MLLSLLALDRSRVTFITVKKEDVPKLMEDTKCEYFNLIVFPIFYIDEKYIGVCNSNNILIHIN